MWHFVELKEAREGQRTTDGQMTERPEKACFEAVRATFWQKMEKDPGAAGSAGREPPMSNGRSAPKEPGKWH